MLVHVHSGMLVHAYSSMLVYAHSSMLMYAHSSMLVHAHSSMLVRFTPGGSKVLRGSGRLGGTKALGDSRTWDEGSAKVEEASAVAVEEGSNLMKSNLTQASSLSP